MNFHVAEVVLLIRQNGIMKTQTSIIAEQARAAEQQAGYMRDGLEVTRGAADAAKGSADAARRSAEAGVVAAKALKVIHRQWISVHDWGFETWTIPNYGVEGRVSVDITNNTPLPLTLFTVRCYFGGSKGGHSVADQLLEPTATTRQTVTHRMDDKQLADYQAGHLTLVLSGWVHYWDAFGDLQSQVIGVCLEHIGPKAQPAARGVSGLMRNMPRMEKDWPVQELLNWMEQHDCEKDAKGEW
jgi:hypothetical protein